MSTGVNDPQSEIHKEFLQSLHQEKIATQDERAKYALGKLGFLTAYFAVSSVSLGGVDLFWLLFLVPLVAIGYDLYIRAADLSIKRMGAFLRSHPMAGASESEKAWEIFAAQTRDAYAPLAAPLFTAAATIAAAIYIGGKALSQTSSPHWLWVFIFTWLIGSLACTTWLWIRHRTIVNQLDGRVPRPDTSQKDKQ